MARFACLAPLCLAAFLTGCQEPEGIGILMGQLKSAQDGKPYVNAEVVAVYKNTRQTASTDTKGNYRFSELPSGLYNVKASMGTKGKTSSTQVKANQVARLNFIF